MNSIVELITAIRTRPPVYIGCQSVSCLRAFLDGWRFAKPGGISDEEVFEDFQAWLQKKYRIRGTQSWDRIILFYSQDEADALHRFFKLFDEFLKDRGATQTQE